MNLLKKDEKFVRNEVQDKAFRELRDLLFGTFITISRFHQAFHGNNECIR